MTAMGDWETTFVGTENGDEDNSIGTDIKEGVTQERLRLEAGMVLVCII